MSNLIGSNILGNDTVTQGQFKTNIELFRQFVEDAVGTDSTTVEASIIHDNTISGLDAVTVKGAIEELSLEKLDADINGLREKVIPIDNDELVINDSASGFVPKKIKISTLRSSTVSVPTAYHIYNGSVEATNTVVTNGFSTALYTGNGGTQAINTGVDMATQWGNAVSETFGGLVWLKSRSLSQPNELCDTVRGINKQIQSNTTSVGQTTATILTSFNNNGFNVGSDGSVNQNLAIYASWNFQTTHKRTDVTNHGKAYTEHYNPFTGFTIIKYEGSGIAGHEIPHSLGRKLGITIVKDLSAAINWSVNTDSGHMYLNTTDLNTAGQNESNDKNIVLGSTTGFRNTSTNQYIMYGWANSYYDEADKLIGNYEVDVYQGTGLAGNKVTTRGKPAWIMIKRLDAIGAWEIVDNQRVISGNDGLLYANTSAAETTDITRNIEFLTDGFTLNTNVDTNASGGQYLYMVVYDNDSGSGKSKYPKATDTTNLSINALVPYANGIDVKGSKVNISYKNETITGLTLTQGKNYPYSKNDGTYGVKPYEPRMLSSELVRRFAGEQPDYFDVNSNKWFNTDAGSDLVTNGKFGVNTSGWTAINSTLSIVNNTLRVTTTSNYGGAYQTLTNLVVGKTYRYKLTGSLVTSNQFIIRVGVPPFTSYDYQSAWQTVSGSVYIDFVALYTTMAIEFVFGSTIGVTGSIVNISVFATDITPTTEITESRNYLNHIVYADQNGQVTYVEELPKIEYKDVIKANEYQGKNACTALFLIDGTVTPPLIKNDYNLGNIIRTATGVYDIYFETEMENLNYVVNVNHVISGTNHYPTIYVKYLNKLVVYTYASNSALMNANSIDVHIFGGKN